MEPHNIFVPRYCDALGMRIDGAAVTIQDNGGDPKDNLRLSINGPRRKCINRQRIEVSLVCAESKFAPAVKATSKPTRHTLQSRIVAAFRICRYLMTRREGITLQTGGTVFTSITWTSALQTCWRCFQR
jgi:hypothetical protein